jgi:hypothetical protein
MVLNNKKLKSRSNEECIQMNIKITDTFVMIFQIIIDSKLSYLTKNEIHAKKLDVFTCI